MTHWMSTAAKRAGLPGADRLSLGPSTSVQEAWTTACQVLELPPNDLAQAIASAFSMEAIDLGKAEPTAARLLAGKRGEEVLHLPGPGRESVPRRRDTQSGRPQRGSGGRLLIGSSGPVRRGATDGDHRRHRVDVHAGHRD